MEECRHCLTGENGNPVFVRPLAVATPGGDKNACREGRQEFTGGEGGIRTHGTRVVYTAFPVLHLRPLGHLSVADISMVGEARFELATYWSQTSRASQAALHPDLKKAK